MRTVFCHCGIVTTETDTSISDKTGSSGEETGSFYFSSAIGNPRLGDVVLDQSITGGVASAAEREISGHAFIQHTAAVNPGNSGGPLLDTSGRLAGLVTLKADLEGVSFAIPAARIRANYDQLRKSNAAAK